MEEREVSISEKDLELLSEAMYAYEARLKANAKRTKTGYGSSASQAKEAAYLEKAEDIRTLMCKIAYSFI